MMRSMFSGVSGLRTHQSRMDVIAHNIANVNTTAFKSSRMTFADAFSQTIQGASAPNPEVGRGGTNPMQIGLGVNVSSIQRQMSPGAAQRTDDPMHLMIENDGFFVVGDDVQGLLFTRAGDFIRDEEWNILMPNGLLLQGWPTTWVNGQPDRDGDLEVIGPVRGPVQGITIGPEMRSVPPSATQNVRVSGNIRSTESESGEPILSTISFSDSLGSNYSMAIQFQWNPGAAAWDVQRSNVVTRTDDNTQFYLDANGNLLELPVGHTAGWEYLEDSTAAAGTTLQLEFTVNGNPDLTASGFAALIAIDASAIDPNLHFGTHTGGATGDLAIDFTHMTQFATNTSVSSRNMDGMAPGTLIGLSIGPDGIIRGTYSNGQNFPLWQIAIARFDNPAGLMAMGGNLFSATANSGEFDGIGLTPGAAGTQLLGGTLEMSNVDLAGEFTDMITTQRGFQANSRVISTSDEMLQELVNLRR